MCFNALFGRQSGVLPEIENMLSVLFAAIGVI